MDVTSFRPFDTVICPTCSAETNVKRNFGSYRLDQRFAIGGMSVIFAGWDTTLDRRVAIKVLNEQFCNDEARIQAFENEARLTAQVSHPNVVKVYAVGRAYGRFYLVMELIKGNSWEQIISKRGALPEDEVLEIALQVGAGLRAAKSAGMIHRDVKPGNILVDEAGHARLLDFGLALITQDGRAQAEEVWATPYYVPPEALERGIEDFRSDIYAFGASLYHALAGRPPFESTSTSNALLRRAKQTIPRLCQVAPWISPATGEVVDRMMAFHPEHRWGSYAQVLSALDNAKKSAGTQPLTPIHSRKRLQRRRQKSYLGLLFTFLLIALCSVLVLWKPWTKPGPDKATIQAESNDTKSVETPLFNPGGDPEDELYVLWKGARDLVREKKFAQAAEAFVRLSKEPTLAGMAQVWASLEAAVVFSLDGQPARARQLHAASRADLDRLKASSHRQRFRLYAETLSQPPPPSPEALRDDPQDIIDWMASFALALKQWEQGQWSLSLPTFAKVRAASLPDHLEWFRIYQNLADVYLADGVVLTQLSKLIEPTHPDEVDALITTLDQATAELRTRGRAPYNLKARKEQLDRIRRQLNRNPSASPVASDWKNYQKALKRSGTNLRFDDIAALLENPPSDAPTEALWAWRFLHENSLSFIRDLTSLDDWNAQRKDGLRVTPVSGNRNGLRLADGSLVPWDQFKPSSLLKERVDDDLHAIAFAMLTGLTGQAAEMAEALAKNDEEFRKNWRRVILGLNP